MFDASHTLGERIIQAARLAVIEHLAATISQTECPRQQITIGGTDFDQFTDEPLPHSAFMADIAEGGAE